MVFYDPGSFIATLNKKQKKIHHFIYYTWANFNDAEFHINKKKIIYPDVQLVNEFYIYFSKIHLFEINCFLELYTGK